MRNKVKKEIISLYAIQLSNIAIPLLTFPYFTRILGVEGVGKIGFAQTLFMLFSFLMDFGFNLSGAKTISVLKQKNIKYDEIYSNIIIFKIFSYIALLVLSLISLSFFDLTLIDRYIVLLILFSSLSSVLIPNFLFNALNINSKLALITLVVRVLCLIPIFLLIKNKDDIIWAVILQFFPNILIGVIAQLYIIKNISVKFSVTLFSYSVCLKQVQEAFHNFSASFFTLGFTYTIPLLIKFFLGDYSLGIYTMVDKLMNIMRQLYVPIVQAFYAKICVFYEQKKWSEYNTCIKKITILFILIGLLAWGTNEILGEWLLQIIFGNISHLNYYMNLAIFTQIIISLAIIMVNFYILPSEYGYILKKIYATAFLLFIPIFYSLQEKYALSGVFYAMQIIEFLITGALLFFLYKKRAFKLGKNAL